MSLRTNGRSGFTLAELVVGVVIVAMIGGSVVIALGQSIDSERRSRARQEAFRRANAAAELIVRDARALLRDADLFNARLDLSENTIRVDSADELLMLCRVGRSSSTRALEGDSVSSGGVFEVQYRLQSDLRPGAPIGGERGSHVLWRRVDALRDEHQDAGGVLYPVVEGIRSLDVRVHNGEDWVESWNTDLLGYPHALRVEVFATSDDGSVTQRAVRIASIDRVPLPVVKVVLPADGSGGGG